MPRPTRYSRALLAALLISVPLIAATPAVAAEPGDARTAPTTTSVTSANQSRLTLQVVGLEKLKGKLMVGLYNDESGFENEIEIKGRTVPVKSATEEIVFGGLPAGNYALKVFHDEDADGSLDTNFMGIPSEPYGFSNNAADPFSAPEWEETKFKLGEQPVTHVIDLG